METIKEELKGISETFYQQVQEDGWVNSAKQMQKFWYIGATLGAQIVQRNLFQIDVQKLRQTQSDAEFRKILNSMLGF